MIDDKYRTIEIKSFHDGKVIVNKRTTSRKVYGCKVCFVCERCKNQCIGSDEGCYEDCNNCKLISDETDTHIYCLNYKETGGIISCKN